ncbi:unnamed protein product, partial [Prunus brigantina]
MFLGHLYRLLDQAHLLEKPEAYTYVPFYADVESAVEGVPISPNHSDPFSLHRIFWSDDNVSYGNRPLVLAGKGRVGGFSPGYQAYWNRCLANFREFQSSHYDKLLPSTARHVGLVSEGKAVPLSEKRNPPFISESGDIVGEFPKSRQKLGMQSPCSSEKGMTPMSGKRKGEEKHSARKEQTASKPRRFISKVVSSGPP